jgi:hypothetical protein
LQKPPQLFLFGIGTDSSVNLGATSAVFAFGRGHGYDFSPHEFLLGAVGWIGQASKFVGGDKLLGYASHWLPPVISKL